MSTVLGIGKLTALVLVAYLCPIERFPNAQKMPSYVGLAPTTVQSADSLFHGRLKRDSNALTRWLLVEATWTHRRRVPRGSVARISRQVARRHGKNRGL